MKLEKFTIILLLILLASGLAQLYGANIFPFEGHIIRDTHIAEGIASGREMRLVGPTSEAEQNSGQQTLGPLYYYLLSAPLLFAKDSIANPVRLYGAIILFNLIAILLTYLFCREFFTKKIGIIAALLFSTAPWAVVHFKLIVTPSFLPVFVLLFMISLFKLHLKNDSKYIILLAFSAAALLHLHLSSLFLLPLAALVVFFSRKNIKLKHILAAIAILFIMFAPATYYNLQNSENGAGGFLSGRLSGETNHLLYAIESFGIPVLMVTNYLGTYWLGKAELFSGQAGNTIYLLSAVVIGIFFLLSAVYLMRYALGRFDKPAILLFAWILMPVFVFAIMGQNVSPHFFIIIWPAPFIIMALFVEKLSKKSWLAWGLLAFILLENITTIGALHGLLEREGGTSSAFGTSYAAKMAVVDYVRTRYDITTPICFIKHPKAGYVYLFEKAGYSNIKLINIPQDFSEKCGGILIIDRFTMFDYGEKKLKADDLQFINTMNRTTIYHAEIAESIGKAG